MTDETATRPPAPGAGRSHADAARPGGPKVADDADASARPSARRVAVACVIAAYVVLGLAAFWPLHPWSSQQLFGPSDYLLIPQDATQIMWFLAWTPHALVHGSDPLFSRFIFTPTGVNLAQNTSSPFLGLVTAFLAPFLGPIARANFVMILAMPVSATAAFIVLRLWRVWLPAAALGGLAYGFAPFAVGQSLAHPFLVFTPFPPFIAYAVVSIVQRRGSTVRLGIVTGLLLAGQYLCSQEIFTTVVLLVGWGLLLAALRRPRRVGRTLRNCWRPSAIAGVVMLAVLAFPVWMLQFGPERYKGTAQRQVNPFHNDLLSFVVPGPLQRVGLGLRSTLPVTSNPSEIGGYAGIGVLALAAVFVWRSRRSQRMQLAVGVLAGAALLSLGPRLQVHGHLTSVPLPFALLDHVPLVQNLLPSRFSFEVGACLAAILAFGLDDARRRAPVASGRRVRAGTVWFLVTVIILVGSQLPRWPYGTQPVQALPTAIRTAMPAGEPVAMTYPSATSVTTQPMVWQAEDSFGFRLIGGFAGHPGPDGTKTPEPNPMQPPDLMDFLETEQSHYLPYPYYAPPLAPVSAGLVAATAPILRANHVRVVLVDRAAPGSARVMELFTMALGPPTTTAGDFAMWASRKGPLWAP